MNSIARSLFLVALLAALGCGSSKAPFYDYPGCVDAGSDVSISTCEGGSVFSCAQKSILSSKSSCSVDADCVFIADVPATCVTICNIAVDVAAADGVRTELTNQSDMYCLDQPPTCGAVRIRDSSTDCISEEDAARVIVYCDAGACAFALPDAG